MKIAVASALFSRYPLDKTFESVARQGYDGLELWGGRPHAYAPDMEKKRVEQILELREAHGLEIPMYAPELIGYPYNLASPDSRERRETSEYLQRCVEVARQIGAPRVEITCGHAGYFTSRRQNWRNLRQALLPVVESAERARVDLVLEPLTPMESNTLCLVDELVELIDSLGSPRVKGMLDTVVPLVNWEPYFEAFEKLGSRLDYAHFVDGNGQDQAHLPLGEGVIDLPALLQVFKRFHFDGWLTIELLRHYVREPEMFAGAEIRKLKRLLRDAGLSQ